MKNNMRPIHPGEILREELEETGLSARAFAERLNVPTNRITAILNGQRALTPDTALRLALFFQNTPEFWLNLQRDYDLKTITKIKGKQIKFEVRPLKVVKKN